MRVHQGDVPALERAVEYSDVAEEFTEVLLRSGGDVGIYLAVLVGVGVDCAVEPEQLLSHGTVVDSVSLRVGLGNFLNEPDIKKNVEMFADGLADYAGMVGKLLGGELAVGRPV